MEVIKSISYNEEKIIQNIIDLHCEGHPIELDPTYSLGRFYRNRIQKPKLRFDIVNQQDINGIADSSNLPLKDSTINSIMFDPPFLATRGKSLKINNSSNPINKRFTVYPNEKKLFDYYKKSIKELYRVLKDKGVLIFKCQDKVSSGKQYFSHCLIYNEALKVGFYPKDLFVLLAKNRIISSKHQNQKHARKFHTYFWVFEKTNPKKLNTLIRL